jgi:hypothetical protein
MTDDASAGSVSRRDRVASAFRRSGKWIAALVLASLVLPAVTTQWSDRQKELSLKESLISQLTLSAATAIEGAHSLVIEETQAGPLQAASLRPRYGAIAMGWNVDIFTLESRLNAYFPHAKLRDKPHTRLGAAVRTYNLRVQDYILLSGPTCSDTDLFRNALKRLKSYLPTIEEEDWLSLGWIDEEANDEQPKRSGPCWRHAEEFRRAYQEPLGLKLLEKRGSLVETIVQSGAEGYYVGFRDLLRQVFSP